MTGDVRHIRCIAARRLAIRLSSGCQAGDSQHGAERGPRWATEKDSRSPDEAPQAICKPAQVNIQQSSIAFIVGAGCIGTQGPRQQVPAVVSKASVEQRFCSPPTEADPPWIKLIPCDGRPPGLTRGSASPPGCLQPSSVFPGSAGQCRRGRTSFLRRMKGIAGMKGMVLAITVGL